MGTVFKAYGNKRENQSENVAEIVTGIGKESGGIAPPAHTGFSCHKYYIDDYCKDQHPCRYSRSFMVVIVVVIVFVCVHVAVI